MNTKFLKIVMFVVCLTCYESITAQTAIGKTSVDGSGIIDFGTENKGIVLPWVEDANNLIGATATDGTMVFDIQTRKVKVRINNSWKDLSINSDNTATHTTKLNTHLAKNELTNQSGVIIGATTSAATGVLVLESSNKALILPKMASPHLNMRDPEPGTIVYDTVKDLLCVYDGKEWSFFGI